MNEKLIQAALDEIKVHSLKFTMDDLTRRLHISKTSLYKMVPSKDVLITAVVRYLIDDFTRKEQVILQSDWDPHKKVVAIFHLYTQMVGPLRVNLYGDLFLLYEEQWKLWNDFNNERIEELLNLIRQGMEQGIYRKVNLAVLKQCLLASSEAVTDSEFLAENNLTNLQVMETLHLILFEGLKNNRQNS